MVRVMYRGLGDEVREDLYPDATTFTASKHHGFMVVQTEEQTDDKEAGDGELGLALYAKCVIVRVCLT